MIGNASYDWKWSAATVTWGCLLLFFTLSSSPPAIPGPLGWDKLEHAVALGLMSYFAASSLRTKYKCWFGFAVGTAFGILIEILQGILTENREADVLDIVADIIGAGSAVLLFNLTHTRENK